MKKGFYKVYNEKPWLFWIMVIVLWAISAYIMWKTKKISTDTIIVTTSIFLTISALSIIRRSA